MPKTIIVKAKPKKGHKKGTKVHKHKTWAKKYKKAGIVPIANRPIDIQPFEVLFPKNLRKIFPMHVMGVIPASTTGVFSPGANNIIPCVSMNLLTNCLHLPLQGSAMPAQFTANPVFNPALDDGEQQPTGFSKLVNQGMYTKYTVKKFRMSFTCAPNSNDTLCMLARIILPGYAVSSSGVCFLGPGLTGGSLLTSIVNEPDSKFQIFPFGTKATTLALAVDHDKIFGLTKSEAKVINILSLATESSGSAMQTNKSFGATENATEYNGITLQMLFWCQDGITNFSPIQYDLRLEYDVELSEFSTDLPQDS